MGGAVSVSTKVNVLSKSNPVDEPKKAKMGISSSDDQSQRPKLVTMKSSSNNIMTPQEKPMLLHSPSERSIGYHIMTTRQKSTSFFPRAVMNRAKKTAIVVSSPALDCSQTQLHLQSPMSVALSNSNSSNSSNSSNLIHGTTAGSISCTSSSSSSERSKADALVTTLAMGFRGWLLETAEMYQKLPKILPYMHKIYVRKGDILCQEGTELSMLYVIEWGCFEKYQLGTLVPEDSCQVNAQQLQHQHQQSSRSSSRNSSTSNSSSNSNSRSNLVLGFEEFLFKMHHSPFTVMAKTDGLVWGIHSRHFATLRALASPLSLVKKVDFLKAHSTFQTLTPQQLLDFLQAMSSDECEAGTTWISRKSNYLYFLERGHLSNEYVDIPSGGWFTEEDLLEMPFFVIKTEKKCPLKYWYISEADVNQRFGLSSKKLRFLDLKTQVTSQEQLEEIREIGEGSFGKVFMVRDKRNGCIRAMKRMAKTFIVEMEHTKQLFNERDVLKAMNHPFIQKLYGTFQDSQYVYIVTEMISGGELWSRIYDNGGHGLSPKSALFYAANVVSALNALHSQNIAYRDLKPENLMIDSQGYLKLIDMGFAKKMEPFHGSIGLDCRSTTICGTPEYLAPEFIHGKGYGIAVDYWALGILLFEMHTGYTPFATETNDHSEVFERILETEQKGVEFPCDFKKRHPEATKLIQKLLCWHPHERISCGAKGLKEIFHHSYFKSISWVQLENCEVEAPYKPVHGITELCRSSNPIQQTNSNTNTNTNVNKVSGMNADEDTDSDSDEESMEETADNSQLSEEAFQAHFVNF